MILGGDTYFGGSDNGKCYYSPELKILYLRNPNPDNTGIMGMTGNAISEFDAYGCGYYETVDSWLKNEELSTESWLAPTDENRDLGYGIKWSKEVLASGEVWTIRT